MKEGFTMETVTLYDRSVFTIYYEDTDFSGFVYHANYLKFFERAREHLISIELLKSLYGSGLHFVVTDAVLKYKAPAHFGDQIAVESEASFSRSPRITFKQNALSKEGKLLVTGLLDIVLVNEKNLPQRLDQSLLQALRRPS